MAVLHALRRTPPALIRNPVLLVPVLVLMFAQLPPLLLQSVDPLFSSIASLAISLLYLICIPFFQGGMISMADDALDGTTNIRTFLDAGKTNYVSLLVAYLILLAVYFVLALVGVFLGVAGFATVLGSGGLESANLAILLVFAGLLALFMLLYLVAVFFLQFYGQAIVLEDTGAIDGIQRSYTVVRHNLLSTLGYTLLTGFLGLLLGGVFAASSIILSPQPVPMSGLPAPSPGVVALVASLITAVGTVAGAFFLVYSVSFFQTITTTAST